MTIEVASDNNMMRPMPVYEDRNISELCIEFIADYEAMHKGVTPTVLECGIRQDTFYILAAIGKPTVMRADKGMTADGEFIYHYGTPEWTCSFAQFSEVGQPYQPWFQNALQSIAITTEGEADLPYIMIDGVAKPKETHYASLDVGEHFWGGAETSRFIKRTDTEAYCDETTASLTKGDIVKFEMLDSVVRTAPT